MAHRIAEKLPVRQPLRVLHRGLAMVPDYRALMDTGTRRHHGLKFDSTLGPEDVFVHSMPDGKIVERKAHHGGWVKLVDEPAVIAADDPHYMEYVRHLKDGDLWAADQATADAAGVAFEPDFGGDEEAGLESEHPETAAGEEASKVRAARAAIQARHLAETKKAEDAKKPAQPPKPALVDMSQPTATETGK